METLTQLIYEDMKPALGVTEPGAIAYACALARSYTKGNVEKLSVKLNSGIYKNAFTCGIPNSPYVGNCYAAALGVVAGKCDKGLESLESVTEADNAAAKKLIEEERIEVLLGDISSRIDIQVKLNTTEDECRIHIEDAHTHVTEIFLNGTIVYSDSPLKKAEADLENEPEIHKYTLEEIVSYCREVPLEEISFIREGYKMNLELFRTGMESEKTTFLKSLLKANGGKILSENELATAQLLCSGTIEARVAGLEKPAMSITGSGAHGIICTMPLYAVYKVNGYSEEELLRATALSYLVTMYIKEYSGKLSAFCGCAVAAGTGMACGCVFLKGGGIPELHRTINNMASSITGMICDGGNQGCTMKGVVAVDAAFRSAAFAMENVFVQDDHGINAVRIEDTFRYMGMIASPGMVNTEEVIVKIFEEKQKVSP